MMNIPSSLLLVFGLTATMLFVGVLVAAWIIIMRNRRIIHRYAKRQPTRG